MTQQIDLDNELIPTIDPKKLTLADWRLIAAIQEYKVTWVFKIWLKAKGAAFLKAIDIDHWISFATFLSYGCNWATQRYMEYRAGVGDGEEAS